MTFILAVCVVAYLLAAGIQLLHLVTARPLTIFYSATAVFAVLLQGILLYHWIDGQSGQNLAFLNMLSFLFWVLSVWIVAMFKNKALQNLAIIIFPMAAITMVLVLAFPSQQIFVTSNQPSQLIHILSAVAAFSVLSLAFFQALVLALQEGLLRKNYSGKMLNQLPPIESMEKTLFQMITLGFGLLTLVIVSSFYFFSHLFIQPMLGKTVLVVGAWIIFGILLLGRYFFGWRGRNIVYQTVSGFVLLIVIYFGSQFI
jgi:ABC-type uncharacterized transport system permease subunit